MPGIDALIEAADDDLLTLIYLCPGCGRWRPWCDGGADDMPEHCDRCWAASHASWWRRALRWLRLTDLGDHGCSACAPWRPVPPLPDEGDPYELYPIRAWSD